MLIGYMRVSKADGSQVLDLQRDALIQAGVDSGRIYEDVNCNQLLTPYCNKLLPP